MKRWTATVYYKTDGGTVDVEHNIEELDELQGIIERGPDWNTIVNIRIALAVRGHDLTVEQAAKL